MLHLHDAARIAIRAGAVAFGCGLVAAAAQVPPEADLWLMPSPTLAGTPALGTAVSELESGRADRALPSFARATTHPVLGGYARLYQGRAEFLLKRYDAALASAKQVAAQSPNTYLGESALWLLADAAEAAGRWSDVAQALRAITDLVQPSDRLALAHLRLGELG